VGLRLFHFCKRIDDSIRDGPSQKVQLGARRRQTLELDALGPAKRIKKLFTVPVQTRLVRDVHRKELPIGRRQRHVVVLRVVGHEPLELSERRALALDNIVKFLTILGNLKELGQTG
jgi:hypothetical protein